MALTLAAIWPQPLNPAHSALFSTLLAALPLIVVLVLMGGLRRSGLFSSLWGLTVAGALAVFVWRMPVFLAAASTIYGAVYAVWPILWIVLCALWLYNLTVETGKFELLRHWIEQHVSSDPCVQAILVAFCFGALLEGTAGFGAPVAVTAFLLVGLGYDAALAVKVALVADTAPVAFGALGIPVVALAGVTGLDLAKLSAMVGRQVPVMSLILPAYLVCVVAGVRGLRRTWPAALIAGASFAATQFAVSNYWGPFTADILAAGLSMIVLLGFLRIWKPSETPSEESAGLRVPPASGKRLSAAQAMAAWMPWVLLAAVVVLWSLVNLPAKGAIPIHVPRLHNGVLITLYQKPYAALYTFQPLATGTAVLVSVLLSAVFLRARPAVVARSGWKTFLQLRTPGLTTIVIVGMAYLYNYSGMAYTLGAAMARTGHIFPVLSSYLGWVACFLSGSDTSSNLLFGNLQVVVAHQLHISPVLLAATNSSGAVAGKMISPQNIAIGVTTVGLVAQEGKVLRSTFWHSVILAALISFLAYAQAYWATWLVPR
ncbi:MAG TPA: L-lactate permease [Candidatus Aquilonibacter sp.]|nr:L-lactate permease [Candidatus Aquilonibacter sp.]